MRVYNYHVPEATVVKDMLLDSLSQWGAYTWHEAQTGSIYIKFPHWGLGSIRIGDHKGRSKYTYRWIVRLDKNLNKYILEGKTRIFSPNLLDELVRMFELLAAKRGIKPGDKQTWEESQGVELSGWKKRKLQRKGQL